MKELASLIVAQVIIEDGISYSPRVSEHTDQRAVTKETCLTHKKEQETGAARLNDLSSQ